MPLVSLRWSAAALAALFVLPLQAQQTPPPSSVPQLSAVAPPPAAPAPPPQTLPASATPPAAPAKPFVSIVNPPGAKTHFVPPPERGAFVQAVAGEYGLSADAVAATLSQAEYKQGIVDAMTRPAESKPWKEYRPLLVTPQRIVDGRRFYAQHRAALDEVARKTGVPAALIVAIIGIETSYGRNTGKYRVLDALYTLAFSYPRSGDPARAQREHDRQTYFRQQLGVLFGLAKAESLPVTGLLGSYAGAMGWGQFMPSSYLDYAVDGDGDGRRDLFGSPKDVFASIANYFVGWGWRPGEPITMRARRDAGAAAFEPPTLEPTFSLAQLGEMGYHPGAAIGRDLPATLVNLEGGSGPEYWLGFRNFYVITRYNNSRLYAMAVHDLSQAIGGGVPASGAP